MPKRPSTIIFDLFDTLVDVDWAALPRRRVGTRERVVTIDGIDELLIEAKSGLSLEVFFDHLDAANGIIGNWKGDSDCEVSSAHRFRLALERAGVSSRRNGIAVEMSLRHMRTLASVIRFPDTRRDVLIELRREYSLGLVSNFDHGPTGRALLQLCGIEQYLDSALISDEMGLRKPSSLLFLHACRLLDVAPAEAWYIGDSFEADVLGATRAGLEAVWVNSGTEPAYPALGRIPDVAELPRFLRQRLEAGL